MKNFYGFNMSAFFAGYIEALYFANSATNCNGETVEYITGVDMTEDALDECRQDCAQFLELAGAKVDLAIAGSDEYTHTMAGRDFWFSRQGHGVGFWDRGLGLLGDDLHKVAELFGEKHLYINERGLLEVE